MYDEKKQDAFKENGICTLGTAESISARIDGTDMLKPSLLSWAHPKSIQNGVKPCLTTFFL